MGTVESNRAGLDIAAIIGFASAWLIEQWKGVSI
jgi:hypothetical protein